MITPEGLEDQLLGVVVAQVRLSTLAVAITLAAVPFLSRILAIILTPISIFPRAL